jgi:hypothetical protein
MRALSRYRTFFLILLGAATLGALGLTSWVNPWRATPAPWSDPGFEPYREIEANWNATTKAGLVRSGSWDAALFGSSRTDIALDPRHPAFDGLRCANLGLNAAGIGENHAIFSYFMDHESPRLVVFSIDPGDLTTPDRKRFKGDFTLSPLDPSADPTERELRYRAGVTALSASGTVISRRLRHHPAEHTPQGFRREAPFPKNQRKLIRSLYLPVTYRYALKHKRTDALNPHKLALVDDIIRRCRENDTRLVFLIPPNQALFMLAFRELGDPDPFFARDRRALAERAAAANAAAPDAPPVELWDFLDAHPLNCQPLPPPDATAAHMPDWLDIYHSGHRIGDLMLDRLRPGRPSPPTPPYGVILTPDLVDSRVASIAAGLDAYTRAHPGDLAFLREALASFR